MINLTKPWALYNEIDTYAADWLENLIAAGHIAPGIVDRRSIEDLRADDLRGFRQVHFFAGIGVWSYAIRRAGISDDTALWTGSCPCQPFSAAGKGGGMEDERHLWPAFFHLIRECRPPKIYGEQVASKDGLAWLDLVSADMEGEGYAFGAVDTCSASVGAPHIRQRLRFAAYDLRSSPNGMALTKSFSGWSGLCDSQSRGNWRDIDSDGCAIGKLADSDGDKQRAGRGTGTTAGTWSGNDAGRCGAIDGLDDDDDKGLEGLGRRHKAEIGHREGSVRPASASSKSRGLADAPSVGRREQCSDIAGSRERSCTQGMEQRSRSDGVLHGIGGTGPTNGFWRDADWLFCRDGKWRPVEPGTFPLAHGAAARVGRLRAYGNAVDAEATREFIEAFLEKDTIELVRVGNDFADVLG